MTEIVFIAMLIVFFLVGILPALKPIKSSISRSENQYHLASRSLGGWIGGLSAATSSHSAFMLTGMVGAIVYDFAFVWLLIGWFIGALCAWVFVYPKILYLSNSLGATTLTQLAFNFAQGKDKRFFVTLVSIALALIMGFYASAQIVAATATLQVVLSDGTTFFVLFSFFLVLTYSAIGGIRSTVTSDVIQGLTVIISVVIVCFYLINSGSELTQDMSSSDTSDLIWRNGLFSTLIFVLGWFVGGISEIAAPHVMARIMSLRNRIELKKATVSYFTWFGFLCVSVVVFSILVSNSTNESISNASSTIIFGVTVRELLPEILIGIALAGFIAATISTADSLILAAGAAVSEDIYIESNDRKRRLITGIIGVITFTVYFIASSIISTENLDLYNYITLAWALLACLFAPAIFVGLMNRQAKTATILIATVSGFLTIIVWRYFGLHNTIAYELLPGLFVATCLSLIFSVKKERFSE